MRLKSYESRIENQQCYSCVRRKGCCEHEIYIDEEVLNYYKSCNEDNLCFALIKFSERFLNCKYIFHDYYYLQHGHIDITFNVNELRNKPKEVTFNIVKSCSKFPFGCIFDVSFDHNRFFMLNSDGKYFLSDDRDNCTFKNKMLNVIELLFKVPTNSIQFLYCSSNEKIK